MTALCRILPLTVAGLILSAAAAHAQSAFPPPPPFQSQAAPASAPHGFPPPNSASPSSFPAPAAGPPPFMGGGAPPPGMGGFGVPAQQSAPPDECVKGFVPLRQETEKKGAEIHAAQERKADPEELCKLFTALLGSETKLMKFVEANTKKCGIPAEVGPQMKAGRANIEKVKGVVCNAAQQRAQAAAPSLSDALGTSAAMPEVQTTKKGGSTFDTLNGNALSR